MSKRFNINRYKYQCVSGRRYLLPRRTDLLFKQTLYTLFKKTGVTKKTKYILHRLPIKDIYFLNQQKWAYLAQNLDKLLTEPLVLYRNVAYALLLMMIPRTVRPKRKKRR